jgi:hypothetical protein
LLNFITLWLLVLFMFFYHLFPWLYGSIINGHLLDDVQIIPFDTDKESAGSPFINQSRINTGSPNYFSTVKSWEKGIPFTTKCCIHSFRSLFLNNCVKVPT